MQGKVTGGVRAILRLEGLAILISALAAYSKIGNGWSTFAILFLTPDLSFLGYLISARSGAIAYNSAHSYIGAAACLAASLLFSTPFFLSIGLIWCAHIGFDRTLGYGLKYQAGFSFTHLGRIGRHSLS